MENVCISDETIINTYKAIGTMDVLSSSDPGIISTKVVDRAGLGPNTRFTFYGYEKNVRVDMGKTDSEAGLRIISIGGEPGIQVTTASKVEIGSHPPKNPLVVDYAFPVYHSLLQVVRELVIVHKIPLEQAVIHLLQHRSTVKLIDAYVSFKHNSMPTKITSAVEGLIALEGHLLGIYYRSKTKYAIHLNTGTKEILGGAIYPHGDYTLIPVICVRKTSDDMYAIYYNSNAENVIKRFLARANIPDVPDKVVSDVTIMALLTKVIDTHIVYPLPHISQADISQSIERLLS
jgi:hypothetical protein